MKRVRTKDAPNAGTDNLVGATILRDGVELMHLRLDYASENDLERGAQRDYVYLALPRRNDETPELPVGIGRAAGWQSYPGSRRVARPACLAGCRS